MEWGNGLSTKVIYLNCNLELVERANVFHQDSYSELMGCFLDKEDSVRWNLHSFSVNNPIRMGIKIP